MEIKELRIGNCLQYKNTNDIAIVELIHKKHFDCRDEYGSFTPNGNYQPIPLTEEWLLKFGFNPLPFANILNSYTKSIGRNRILSVGNVSTPNEMIFLCEINATDDKKIDDAICIRNYDYDKYTHVHQLQNLYFALTNEELTIK